MSPHVIELEPGPLRDALEETLMTVGERTILHVIESYGAGSARAAETYALATPQYRHVLLRRPRVGEYIEGQELRAFAEVHDLPAGGFRAIREIRRVTRRIRPTRLHAHSSWAGALARTALPVRVARRRLVYTPHCFAFERLDLPLPARFVFGLIELLLSAKTDVIAACSERERERASRMWARRPPVHVPNVAALPGPDAPIARGSDLIGIGRVGPQKDPMLFAEIARMARAAGVADGGRWLGGGDHEVELQLVGAGLQVSGWIGTDAIAAACRTGSTYVHTARWEGFPLSILEAHRCGLPIIARRIPALADAPSDWLFSTPAEAVDLLTQLARPSRLRENLAQWSAYLSSNTVEVQQERLARVYDGRTP